MNAVDTNVFVYAFDADEVVKRPKAEELLDGLAQQSGETVLLWQVAGEFLNCLRKWEFTGRMSAADKVVLESVRGFWLQSLIIATRGGA